MLPSASSLYRAQQSVRTEGDKYYDVNWARLEDYLNELDELNNDCHVVIEKNPDNSFKRYFIGLSPVIEVCVVCNV